MPINQPIAEPTTNDYSEEVDHILSSLPKWLKKWNVLILLLVISGSLLIYELFEIKLRYTPIYTIINVYPEPQGVEVKNLSKISQVYAVKNSRVLKGDTLVKFSEIGSPTKDQFLIAPITGILSIKGDLKHGSILRKNQTMIEISAEVEKTIYGELKIPKTQMSTFKPGREIKIELNQEGKGQTLQASIQQVEDNADSLVVYYQVFNPDQYKIKSNLKKLKGTLIQEKTKLSFHSFL